MKKVLVIGTLCLIAIACRNTGSSSHLCVHTDPVPVAPEATNGDEYLYTITVNDLEEKTMSLIAQENDTVWEFKL